MGVMCPSELHAGVEVGSRGAITPLSGLDSFTSRRAARRGARGTEIAVLEAITGLPDGVIGFEAVGKVDADDYRDTLIPGLEAQSGPLRLVYVLGDRFTGYTSGAAWQDTKLGLDHHGKWHRAAIVTDAEWVNHLASAFGWMVPGAFEVFPLSERDAAIAWVASG
jgi:hypothetical protein